MALIPLKEKILTDRFLQAEEIRNNRKYSKLEILKNKEKPYLELRKKASVLNGLQESLESLHYMNCAKKSIKIMKDKSAKIQESIILHRKVMRDVLKQSAKIKRKTKSLHPRMDPLPYLANFRKKLINSIDANNSYSESEFEAIAAKEKEETDKKISSKEFDTKLLYKFNLRKA